MSYNINVMRHLLHYRDLAMLLRDPYAINVICGSILKTLSMLMQHEKLPRVCKICTCMFCRLFPTLCYLIK